MIKKEFFGSLNGSEVFKYTISAPDGSFASVLDYGGAVQALCVKDKGGNLTDVALGYNTLSEYADNGGYLGALIGRYANRIKEGLFTLGGKSYRLYANNGKNHLHGGKCGFDKKIWQAEIKVESLILRYVSKDMEEGYPGELCCEVCYSFDGSSLNIAYRAECSEDCPVNLTNHTYFNLNGEGSNDILGHSLKINASNYLETDSGSIPLCPAPVQGTPFDFRTPCQIGKSIGEKHPQLLLAKGYDHNYCLIGEGEKLCAEAYSEKSGILMQVYTDREGLQFYSGNYLDGSARGKGGAPYLKNHGFCLETQAYPDSPNRTDFPSSILKKGAVYSSKTSYVFSVK